MTKIKSPLKHRNLPGTTKYHDDLTPTLHAKAHDVDVEEEIEEKEREILPQERFLKNFKHAGKAKKTEVEEDEVEVAMKQFRVSGFDNDGPIYTDEELVLIEKRLREDTDEKPLIDLNLPLGMDLPGFTSPGDINLKNRQQTLWENDLFDMGGEYEVFGEDYTDAKS